MNLGLWHRKHDNCVYKGYRLVISGLAEDSVLSRIERLSGKKIICYPQYIGHGKTAIDYWRMVEQERARIEEEDRLFMTEYEASRIVPMVATH